MIPINAKWSVTKQTRCVHSDKHALLIKKKFKKKFNPARNMDGRPPQANLVEQKMDPRKGRNKRQAVLMFEEKHEENDNSLDMEVFNYNQDKHSLIDEDEFLPNNLSELDPTFVTDVCESLEDN
jgi:hypothetical protein